MSLRSLTVLAVLTVAMSCRSSPAAPDGALLGRFGAATSEVILTATEVRLRGACGEFVGVGALVPGPDGRFVHTLHSLSSLRGVGVYVLRGLARGDLIIGEILTVSSVSTSSAPFSCTRNVTPNFSGIFCAA